MPGWDDFPVGERIRLVIDAPVLVENDANAMAAGEQTAEPSECRPLCLVKVSTGIGAGMVIGGHVYTGSDGGAGDIGHVRLHGEKAVCQCGSRGCLAAVASGRAVAQQLGSRASPPVTAVTLRDCWRPVTLRRRAWSGRQEGASERSWRPSSVC